jgi:hypothetical protein
MRPS